MSSTNTDFRVKPGFFRHPKTVKLKRRLGAEGTYSLLTLWAHAAENKPDGSFTGMDAEDIAIAADYDGDAQVFVKALCDIGFLEACEEGIYHLHDWSEHNPWAASAPMRSEAARNAANARWAKQKGEKGNTESCAPHCAEDAPAMPDHAERMRPASNRNAPSPSPSPSPNPIPEEKTHTSTAVAADAPVPAPADESGEVLSNPDPKAGRVPPCPYQAIADLYNATLPMLPQVREVTKRRKRRLSILWRNRPERQKLDWWQAYFQRVTECPFLLGLEGNGKWRADFDWLIDPENEIKVLEGKFLPRTPAQGQPVRRKTGNDLSAHLDGMVERLMRDDTPGYDWPMGGQGEGCGGPVVDVNAIEAIGEGRR